MTYLLGVLLMALGIALSIALHEIGHLVPAKKFGVKVTQYMVGFGPTIWARRRGETEYGIKAIPLGGYVRMIGMFPPRPQDGGRLRASSTGRWSQMAEQARAESMEEVGPGDEDRVFYKLPVWKRVIIMFGGPLMNLVIAAVVLTGILVFLGLPASTPKISSISECAPTDVTATDCTGEPPSPALASDLEVGDRITHINGVPVDSWAEASYEIQNSGEQALFVVERAGETIQIPATLVERDRPVYNADGTLQLDEAGEPVMEPRRYFGASGSIEYAARPVTEAPAFVGGAVLDTARIFLKLPEKLVGVYQAAFGNQERDVESPMSVVGVGRVAGEVTDGSLGALTDSVEGKAVMLLSLLASLNIALFVFNLVPLLPLDGGHIAGALWEGVKKAWARVRGLPEPAPVDIAKALPIAYTVALVLVGMTVLLVYADLVNPVRLAG
ncbi:M50 family metallopeptidase [Ornithinimicrobium cavernae]|uniref:M50 family metallopeptidase n=1 Tax=Ornithinimicrobium cavernae TaxID=2666047 RepID=UPI000D691D7C|nr:site-2 protease family protein [Ornithinimicrobium cavernae]